MRGVLLSCCLMLALGHCALSSSLGKPGAREQLRTLLELVVRQGEGEGEGSHQSGGGSHQGGGGSHQGGGGSHPAPSEECKALVEEICGPRPEEGGAQPQTRQGGEGEGGELEMLCEHLARHRRPGGSEEKPAPGDEGNLLTRTFMELRRKGGRKGGGHRGGGSHQGGGGSHQGGGGSHQGGGDSGQFWAPLKELCRPLEEGDGTQPQTRQGNEDLEKLCAILKCFHGERPEEGDGEAPGGDDGDLLTRTLLELRSRKGGHKGGHHRGGGSHQGGGGSHQGGGGSHQGGGGSHQEGEGSHPEPEGSGDFSSERPEGEGPEGEGPEARNLKALKALLELRSRKGGRKGGHHGGGGSHQGGGGSHQGGEGSHPEPEGSGDFSHERPEGEGPEGRTLQALRALLEKRGGNGGRHGKKGGHGGGGKGSHSGEGHGEGSSSGEKEKDPFAFLGELCGTDNPGAMVFGDGVIDYAALEEEQVSARLEQLYVNIVNALYGDIDLQTVKNEWSDLICGFLPDLMELTIAIHHHVEQERKFGKCTFGAHKDGQEPPSPEEIVECVENRLEGMKLMLEQIDEIANDPNLDLEVDPEPLFEMVHLLHNIAREMHQILKALKVLEDNKPEEAGEIRSFVRSLLNSIRK